MIRFTWLQSRTQTAMALVALLVAAAFVALTGPHLVHLYNTTVATCVTRGDCQAVTASYLRSDSHLRSSLGVLIIVIPGIIGLFFGAPLVARELEAGTYRLVWTQSVTRTRWLAVKLGVIGLTSMAIGGLFSLMVTWWSSPLDRVRMDAFATFDQRDIVPIGYAVFAFALGVTAGVVIRRTVPAMAATLVAFVGARLVVIHWFRPRFIAPVHQDFAITSASVIGAEPGPKLAMANLNLPNAWIQSTHLVDNAGRALTPEYLRSACPSLGVRLPELAPTGGAGLGGSQSRTEVPAAVQDALHSCATTVAAKFHEVVTYQPARDYWPLQWCELAIFVGAAVVLGGVCLWWVRHRLS